MTFPRDDYTPFGYLANPYHRARSWTEPEAGLLRTTDDLVGLGWVEPTARKPQRELAIVLVVRWNGRVYQTRDDFARLGYRSSHHSSELFSYDWEMDQMAGSLSFALAERDVLVAELRVENRGALPATCEVFLVGIVVATDRTYAAKLTGDGWTFASQWGEPEVAFGVRGAPARRVGAGDLARLAPELGASDRVAAGFARELALAPGEVATIGVGLARAGVLDRAERSAGDASRICAEKRTADDAFYADVTLPVGDWPDSWRRGWIYDLETTRGCIYPAGGIFHREWPSWMMAWPRVVVAEGILDAARFSYASPTRALGLAETIFADAEAPNVPCVFQGGEPNMVAKDGARCGTSPAWCLPFHNLWLLYWRTLDRGWLGRILPRLEAYVDYWLTERVDEDGWIVYKCTWEAGEDATPRLDPQAEGDAVISHFVRPVELQATVSYSAAILARFARELGDGGRERRWSAVATSYAARTRRLWDPQSGRYRDWDKRTNDFLRSPGETSYWQTDPIRFSALSLTPIVAGLVHAEQKAALEVEIEYYDAVPWCLWPSWSYVVAEAATAAGWHRFAGKFAHRIADRVYRANDRRTLADSPRPTPGTAPEFWPLDLAAFDGSDGYGWGATTTSLWIRQIFGFLDGTDSSEFSFTLAPNLPIEWLRPGRRFGFQGFPYRGRRLDLGYEVTPTGLIAVVGGVDPVAVSAFASDDSPLSVTIDQFRREARIPVDAGTATRIVFER